MRFLILSLLLAAPTVLVQEPSADELFYRAFQLEVATRDFEAARDAYAQCAQAASTSKRSDLMVKSLLGQGRCLKILGKGEESAAAFAKVLELEPENAEAKAALGDPAAEDLELIQYLIDLTNKLGTGEREQAEKDLLLVGARAVPMLAQTLRAKQAGIVKSAALILAQMGNAASRDALANALQGQDLVFPEIVVDALGNLPKTPESVAVFEAALARPETELRAKAMALAANWYQGNSPKLIEPMRALTASTLHDPAVDVRIAVLQSELPKTAAAVAPCLESADPRERLAALGAIDHSSNLARELAAQVPALLRDQGADLRLRALNILGNLAQKKEEADALRASCRDAIAPLLEDPDRRVSLRAADQLARVRAPWTADVADRIDAWLRRTLTAPSTDRDTTSSAVNLMASDAAAALGAERLVSLYALIGSPSSALNAGHREQARARLLSRLWSVQKNEGDLADLLRQGMRSITDEDGKKLWLQEFTSRGFSNRVAAPDAYLMVANDASPAIRRFGYLGLLLERPSVPPVLALDHMNEDLNADDKDLRESAFAVAGKFPSPAFAEGLKRRHDGVPERQRAPILEVLVRCAGKDALAVARKDLDSNDGDLRYQACRAIVTLLGGEAAADLVNVARRRNRATDPLIAFKCQEELRLVIEPEVLTRYLEALPADLYSGGLIELAATVEQPNVLAALRPVVLAILRKGDEASAQAAIVAGNQHIDEAWPFLIALLDHPSNDVREAAKYALDKIRAYRDLKASFEQFGEGGRERAVADAKALLKSDSAEKRRGAALALGALGDPGAVPALLELLSDREPTVREAALQALERLGGKAK